MTRRGCVEAALAAGFTHVETLAGFCDLRKWGGITIVGESGLGQCGQALGLQEPGVWEFATVREGGPALLGPWGPAGRNDAGEPQVMRPVFKLHTGIPASAEVYMGGA